MTTTKMRPFCIRKLGAYVIQNNHVTDELEEPCNYIPILLWFLSRQTFSLNFWTISQPLLFVKWIEGSFTDRVSWIEVEVIAPYIRWELCDGWVPLKKKEGQEITFHK